ncbi:hypothetical protein L6452_00982 [Arctium lappa]|uniref:Uncharacterized protein n=1 Tax=Arctium lappa TaxID=4217 RepID=A0ACB9FEV9_ARCLA|nr:hypothetical protein L6452_00982 [Arctium lappa]
MKQKKKMFMVLRVDHISVFQNQILKMVDRQRDFDTEDEDAPPENNDILVDEAMHHNPVNVRGRDGESSRKSNV